MVFLCLTDTTVKTETAYSFLDTIKDRFFRKYTPDQVAKTISFNVSFTEELKATMEDFNNNPEPASAKGVISDLVDVKNIAADNLSKRRRITAT